MFVISHQKIHHGVEMHLHFFSHLLSQIYLKSETDAIFLLGDFNYRLGPLRDFCVDVENIRTREITDHTQNLHGQSFAEFLLDSKFCVLNGRYGEDSNKFTSVSVKGKAVVDYVCVPHDQLGNCYNFRIKTLQ